MNKFLLQRKTLLLQLCGWVIVILLWFAITNMHLINNRILPTPQFTWDGLREMFVKEDLVSDIFFSIRINLLGYLKCVLTAIPFGFILGLFSTTRKIFSQQINALRFVPITAMMGIFIAISGLTITTKVNFLAFGIWVYLVPVVVQRIDEVSRTHLDMMKTLGASFWQTVRHVHWRSVMARLSDDIRILVGISWTYIIVAELSNVQGGLGSKIFLAQKQDHMGKVYAVIFIIIAIGILQDMLFKLIDKILFRHKYK